jgi:hypothetical protein
MFIKRTALGENAIFVTLVSFEISYLFGVICMAFDVVFPFLLSLTILPGIILLLLVAGLIILSYSVNVENSLACLGA